MIRKLCQIPLVAVFLCSLGERSPAVPIVLVNPGGEDYDTSGGNVAIPLAPIPPGDGTGWNATADQVPGDHAVEGIGNNPNSGSVRLAFGAADGSDLSPEEVILFQQTTVYTPAALDRLMLDFFGRGFFQYQNDVDALTSFFGYVDGTGSLVQVDTLSHPEILSGVWTDAAEHVYQVPVGSPLVGEELVIGFFTDTPDGTGGFAAVDDVSLDAVAIPEPGSLVILAVGGLAGWGYVRAAARRR